MESSTAKIATKKEQTLSSTRDTIMTVDNLGSPVEETSNKNHAADLNDAVQQTRWFLTVLGVWPSVISNPTRIQRLVSKFALPFPSVAIIMLVIPIISHMILRDMARPQFLILLGPISFRLANILKNMMLIARRDTIKICIQHMETDWRRIENENDRDIMRRNLRVGHGLTLMCMACMYSSAVFYQAIMPLLRGKTINQFNETVRPLIFPGADIFINLRAGYNYEIVFFSNCVAAFFLYTIVTAICNLAAILVSHACGQIQIVMSRLENLVGDDDNEKDSLGIEERIAFIIRCHVRVLRFTARIDEILREMCLIEVVASTLIICLLEYYCMTEWKNSSTVAIITYVMLLISLCFNIFIFCHIGELLKGQCQEVGKASYMIDWYKLPSKAGLSLIMVIAMSNYPRKLTAGRMMELSIYSFGSIMKTSVAYLNMLQAVAE